MQGSLIAQIKQHPVLFALSIGLHLVLLVILTLSLSHTSAPRMPPAKKIDTVKAIVIDASVVEEEVQKLKRAEESEQQKKIAQKNRLDREAEKARQKRKQEEQRLAELKKQQEKRKQEIAQREKQDAQKAKAEKLKKQQELAKLKQQQKELEQKRQAEQKRLAELEAKRKAEEEAIRQKKLAQEAEVRRQAEEAEMRRMMQEEERRLAKQSAENQKLLIQYIAQIQRKVEQNWNAPDNMTAGWSCEIMVEQNRFGDVQSVQMKQCTGSEAFKSTVERAVRKSSPLPEAPNNDVFEKKLNFIFRPDV